MIRKWLKIIRAHTLFASACPVLVGGMVYLFEAKQASWQQIGVLILTMLCAMSLQVLANLINDYYDFKQGADQQGRAGFERPLAEGTMNEKTMLRAVGCALVFAILTGLVLVVIGRLPILLIGVSAIFFAWLYTATRYSLAYLGLGDVFVLIFYGLIAAWGAGYLLAATTSFVSLSAHSTFYTLHSKLFSAGAVNGLISMLVLSANNLRDVDDDRPVGKKTFPVRFGKRAGEVLVLVEVLCMPLCAYVAFGWSLPMLMLVPGLYWVWGVWRAEGAMYNRYLEMAGKLNLLYTFLVFLHLLLF